MEEIRFIQVYNINGEEMLSARVGVDKVSTLSFADCGNEVIIILNTEDGISEIILYKDKISMIHKA